MKLDIKINCHSSICINDNIYIDPFKIEKGSLAKVIFITHNHWDHLDKESILKIKDKKTIFISPTGCKKDLLEMGIKEQNIVTVKPFEELNINNVKIKTFPSYNIDKKFHPKSNNWLGYLIKIDDTTYMICGDTDLTEEIKQLKTDILFVPIGGTYTMDAIEGAKLTNLIKPKLVIPVHYGKIVDSHKQEEAFLNHLDQKIEYKILLEKD